MVIGKPNEAYKEMVAAMATVSKPTKKKLSPEQVMLQKLREHKLLVMLQK